jgi:hypothetical protein
MKSSFLLTIALSALTVNVAWAQLTTKPSAEDLKRNEKTTFDKFSDRLKIGYYGAFTSPHLDDIEKGQWRNAAISPEYGNAPKGEQKNHDTWPANLWNQVSFNFNFGAKLNFVFNPRFMTPLAHSRDMKEPEDRAFLMMDDFLVGFQGVILSTDDKKFNLWIRPGVRIPTSRASRNSGQRGAGTITHQTELAYNATYDFNKTWQLGLFGQFRQWVIEDQYGFDRFRIYTAPFIQYTIDDTTRIMTYYENMMETDRRGKPANDRDPVWKDVWQNVMLGVSKDITPKLNIYPYIAGFVNDKPFTDKSLWFGAWISYQIK